MSIQLDALGETGPFRGFVQADFDAFERKKWSSRVYTLERRAARQKLVAILRELHSDLAELQRLELGASDDAPSMANNRKVDAVWAYLTRKEDERRALSSRLAKNDLADAASLFDIATEHQHASLVLLLHLEGVRLEVHLSARARVDRANAARKLTYEDDRAELLRRIHDLPEDASVGLAPELLPPAQVDLSVLERWRDVLEARREPFMVRLDFPRSDPRLASPDLLPLLKTPVLAFVQILDHLAWARENDFAKVGVDEAVEKVERKLGKKKKRAPDSAPPTLAPGARVTILSGLFAGRSGYLAEEEGKGKVKVMVGPVSVSVPVGDIKPA